MIKIQVTFFSTTGKYRPIACIIKCESRTEFMQNKKEYAKKALQKCATARYKQPKDLIEEGFTEFKWRKVLE